jgi:hydrogenase maturation protease
MNNISDVVVVGVGNEFRMDDGVGIYVSRMIRENVNSEIKVIDGIADGYSLVETWDDSSRVFVIDCAASGAEPGKVFRFDALIEKIPGDLFDGFSTHSISIVDAIELAGTLGRLPKSLTVIGIEGKDYSSGYGLSPEIKSAADKLADEIVDGISLKTDHDKQR